MIPPEKHENAMAAVNAVLVLARELALESRAADVGQVLDVAEYLSVLMLDPGDKTAEFREQLVGLAERMPEFVWALERFPLSLGTS